MTFVDGVLSVSCFSVLLSIGLVSCFRLCRLCRGYVCPVHLTDVCWTCPVARRCVLLLVCYVAACVLYVLLSVGLVPTSSEGVCVSVLLSVGLVPTVEGVCVSVLLSVGLCADIVGGCLC